MVFLSDQSNLGGAKQRPVLVALAVSLGLGLTFDWLFFGKLPGVSFPIYMILVVASLLWLARREARKLPGTALVIILPLLFFSAMVMVRASSFITFLNITVSLFLLALFVTLVAKPSLSQYRLVDYLRLMVELPLQVINTAFKTISGLVARQAFLRHHQTFARVARGLLLALPVLFVFGALFASADLVFRGFVEDLFSLPLNGELLGRTILVLMVAAGFVGLFGSIGRQAGKAPSPDQAPLEAGRRRNSLIEVSILFGSLNALFLVFIIVQLAYLFGGASNVVGDSFTYAEYARKGFLELIVAAGLTFLLILVTDRELLRRTSRHARLFKLLAAGLVVQVMVVMISAFKRLMLYESAYGLTVLRLVCLVFIIWLAVVFGVLLHKIVANKRENVLAFALFASVLVLVGSLNAINVDAFVARRNIERFEVGGKLDFDYLPTLSADATPQIVRLLHAKDYHVRAQTAKILLERRQAWRTDDNGWQSFNLSRQHALEVLSAKESH